MILKKFILLVFLLMLVKNEAFAGSSNELLLDEGKDYFEGINGKERDYDKALELFLVAAKQGSPLAEARIAYMYQTGTGVTQDYSEAFKWNLKAAKNGELQAQYNLALMYKDGLGTEKSDTDAFKWLNRTGFVGESIF